MSTDPFRRLIEKWREFAAKKIGYVVVEGYESPCVTLAKCADELEAALAPLSGPVDASGEPELMAHINQMLADSEDLATRSSTQIEREFYRGWTAAYHNIRNLLRAQEHFCVFCHHRWTGEGVTEHCGDCHRQFRAAAVPSSPAQEPKSNRLIRGLASDIVLHVRRGVWHTTEVEQAIAPLAALPPSSPVADSPTWQPMESAPTDHEGPSILTWSANGGVHLTTRGFTAALRRASWFDEKGWSIHPTHWMPLPSAPSAPAAADDRKDP